MTPTTRRSRRKAFRLSNSYELSPRDKATKPQRAAFKNTRGAVRNLSGRQLGARLGPPLAALALELEVLGVEPRAEHAGLARERHGDGRRRDERAERPRRDGGGPALILETCVSYPLSF